MMNFKRVEAGHYRDGFTGLEIRKMGRTRAGRNGYTLPGWAVFHAGREVGIRRGLLREAFTEAADFWAAKVRAEQHEVEVPSLRGCCSTLLSEPHGLHCWTFEAGQQRHARLTVEAERQLEGNRQAERDAAALLREGGRERHEAEAPEPFDHPQVAITSALAKITAAVRQQVLAEQQPKADPATEDEVPELVDRIVRRAQYEALKTVCRVLAGWIEGAQSNCAASGHGGASSHDDGRLCGRGFDVEDIARMINDAADELRVPKVVEL